MREGVFSYDKDGFWTDINVKMNYTLYKMAGFCSDQSSLYKNLRPGTSCQYDYQVY